MSICASLLHCEVETKVTNVHIHIIYLFIQQVAIFLFVFSVIGLVFVN